MMSFSGCVFGRRGPRGELLSMHVLSPRPPASLCVQQESSSAAGGVLSFQESLSGN